MKWKYLGVSSDADSGGVLWKQTHMLRQGPGKDMCVIFGEVIKRIQ